MNTDKRRRSHRRSGLIVTSALLALGILITGCDNDPITTIKRLYKHEKDGSEAYHGIWRSPDTHYAFRLLPGGMVDYCYTADAEEEVSVCAGKYVYANDLININVVCEGERIEETYRVEGKLLVAEDNSVYYHEAEFLKKLIEKNLSFDFMTTIPEPNQTFSIAGKESKYHYDPDNRTFGGDMLVACNEYYSLGILTKFEPMQHDVDNHMLRFRFMVSSEWKDEVRTEGVRDGIAILSWGRNTDIEIEAFEPSRDMQVIVGTYQHIPSKFGELMAKKSGDVLHERYKFRALARVPEKFTDRVSVMASDWGCIGQDDYESDRVPRAQRNSKK